MLEDCTMDKKTAGRAAQLPCKGSGTDCSKKSQDASSTSKSYPRAPRKREASGPTTPKCDQSRKSQAQKSKAFDKRSRPRGQYFAGGKEDTKVEETRAELGSVLGNGSKKVNLNHLLNFHYTPKDGGSYGRLGPPGPGRWLYNTHRHKYNKEQFLQANCQFVVKAEGDYTKYLKDPDILVDWDMIEQIRVQTGELLSCPICLEAPTAARMTRCGHVYCWPCMLHYLALADKAWRKCPICYESVHRDDLKSVVALCHTELSVGGMANMRLMRRERGTLVAEPVQQGQIRSPTSSQAPASLVETDSSNLYCKLLLASTTQVLDILARESGELQQRHKEEEGTPEICFSEQALQLLGQRQASLTGKVPITMVDKSLPVEEEKELAQQMPGAADEPRIIYQSAFDELVQNPDAEGAEAGPCRGRYESLSSEGVDSVDSGAGMAQLIADLEMISVEDLETPVGDSQPSKYFYFYQAADGQHMYLHSLNARMLEAAYGSLEASPPLLRGRIVEKEAGSMTSELRQRLRHLQHLPLTCQFEVVELDLRPPLVTRDTINLFQEQIEQRRKKRQRRSREERRREKRILEEENMLLGRFPTPEIKIESHTQFPECGIEVSSPIGSYHYPDIVNKQSACLLESSELAEKEGTADAHADSGPSFAQMLRQGKSQAPQGWAASPRRQQAPPMTSISRGPDSEPDPEGYVPAPSFSQSFGDAFSQALERAAANSVTEQDSSSTRKKKKNKQKVLFSTNMACNSK